MNTETGDIQQLLLGRKVVRIDGHQLYLDNGASFYIRHCNHCEAGNWWVSAMNGCDNVITKVEPVIEKAGGSTSYKVFVYAEHRRSFIDCARRWWRLGWWYNGYGTGFDLIVEVPTHEH